MLLLLLYWGPSSSGAQICVHVRMSNWYPVKLQSLPSLSFRSVTGNLMSDTISALGPNFNSWAAGPYLSLFAKTMSYSRSPYKRIYSSSRFYSCSCCSRQKEILDRRDHRTAHANPLQEHSVGRERMPYKSSEQTYSVLKAGKMCVESGASRRERCEESVCCSWTLYLAAARLKVEQKWATFQNSWTVTKLFSCCKFKAKISKKR